MLELPHFDADSRAGSITVRGEIDMLTAPALTAKVMATVDCSAGQVTVDMSRVTFFGVSGLSALLEANEAARRCGARLTLTGCPPTVLRMLHITGTRGLFVLATTPNNLAIA